MKRRVVVEDSLTNVSQYLRNQGCEVRSLSDQRNLDACDAVVVSGQDDNFMGMNDTVTQSKIVDATGKTPEDIYNHINNNMR